MTFFKKMIEEKKEYKAQLVRVNNLPDDYKFVMKKIQQYMWNFAGNDGKDMLKALDYIIELFEISAAEGKQVLDVTGEDVAHFCDEFLQDVNKWTDHYRSKLNRKLNTAAKKNKE